MHQIDTLTSAWLSSKPGISGLDSYLRPQVTVSTIPEGTSLQVQSSRITRSCCWHLATNSRTCRHRLSHIVFGMETKPCKASFDAACGLLHRRLEAVTQQHLQPWCCFMGRWMSRSMRPQTCLRPCQTRSVITFSLAHGHAPRCHLQHGPNQILSCCSTAVGQLATSICDQQTTTVQLQTSRHTSQFSSS